MIRNQIALFIDIDLLSQKIFSYNFQQEGYDVIIRNQYCITKNIFLIEKYCPTVIIIHVNQENEKMCFLLGKYLLKKDVTPYIFMSNRFDKISLNQMTVIRPHGIISIPIAYDAIIFKVQIIINNFRHKKIDVLRNELNVETEEPIILKKLIEYIDENIFEKIEINNLLEITKWNSQYLQRLFFKYLSINPHEYIIRKKMKIAMALIIETELPLKQISKELGFVSYSNFYINFQKQSGRTPNEYRKRYNIIKAVYGL